ncbi:hypothetical protein HMPREF3159_10415 [Brachybacterium sp. HMSC06H03]|uniref:hypothetical protein n=1 Tax=Brachybacterium sp. HMSC06H03 TaxID=1581127 RepID=UPI0008A2344D|nr:hypothetical protein [Brachybacterium sp. HMSC06H03]OFT54199.1 hypothetical protein HMPREF3159_10415 [Brachybacterium sp. HMSC06H03]
MNAPPPSSGLHHLELWTADPAASEPAWRRLMSGEGPGTVGGSCSRSADPHASGEDHTAWYAEDAAGIEVELVAGP